MRFQSAPERVEHNKLSVRADNEGFGDRVLRIIILVQHFASDDVTHTHKAYSYTHI